MHGVFRHTTVVGLLALVALAAAGGAPEAATKLGFDDTAAMYVESSPGGTTVAVVPTSAAGAAATERDGDVPLARGGHAGRRRYSRARSGPRLRVASSRPGATDLHAPGGVRREDAQGSVDRPGHRARATREGGRPTVQRAQQAREAR